MSSDECGVQQEEANQLGELRQRCRFLLLDLSQLGRHERREHQVARVPARSTEGFYYREYREDEGLRAQDSGGWRISGGNARRNPHHRVLRGSYCVTPLLLGKPVARTHGETHHGRAPKLFRALRGITRLLNSYSNSNSYNPRYGTDQLRGA